MIVAVISVASPYLTRPVRRLGQLLVLLIAVASLYLGTTLPDGVLAAVALGWTHRGPRPPRLRLPRWPPTAAQVQATLVELGVDAHDVHLLPATADHRHRHGRARRHRRAHGAGARPRRSRRAADVEVLAIARVQGRRPRAPHHPARRRRGAGLRAAARRARRRARSRGGRRRHRRARRRAHRLAAAVGHAVVRSRRRRRSPTRCWSTSGSRWPRCTTRASRTVASTATTWSSTGPPSASATSSSPPAPPPPGAAPPTSPSCS